MDITTVAFVIHCCFLVVIESHVTQPDENVIQGVLERLTSLESKYQRQVHENMQLKEMVTGLQSKVSILHDENQRLQNQMQTLKSRDGIQDEEMTNLRRQMADIVGGDLGDEGKGDSVAPDDRQGEIREPIPNMIAEHTASGGLRRIQRRETEMDVAFFAAISNHLTHMGINQLIVFDQVITNIGNAYNNHAGDFRAPVSGTYVFSVTLMAYVSHTAHYRIAKNGVAVTSIYLRGLESPYATSSMTAVLQLQQGDDVGIQNVDKDESLHGSYYSTFSGFLLSQDFSGTAVVGK